MTWDHINRIVKAAHRMDDLVRGLRHYSQVIRGEESVRVIELEKMVEEVVDELDEMIRENNVDVISTLLPEIEGHPEQIRQLFFNLIHNAIKFRGDKKPWVRIYSLGVENGVCRIAVEDNGIGFDMKYKDLILKPFQQLHEKDSRYEGTGMGLAICRKVINHHDGRISAISAPGKGSTFIVTLPVKQSVKEHALSTCP